MYTTSNSMGNLTKKGYDFIQKLGIAQKLCLVFGAVRERLEMTKYESVKMETKKRIVREFWKLYKIRKIEKITVKNITDACGIYRTTFYLHFSDVYAIREMIEEDVLTDLKNLREMNLDTTEEDYRRGAEALYLHFRKNQEYLHILLDEKRHPEFSKIYKGELIGQMCRTYQVDMADMDQKTCLVVKKTIQLFVELFLNWTASGLLNWEDIICIIDGYMKNGIIDTLLGGISREKKESSGVC